MTTSPYNATTRNSFLPIKPKQRPLRLSICLLIAYFADSIERALMNGLSQVEGMSNLAFLRYRMQMKPWGIMLMAVTASSATGIANALPRNPERPNNSRTCEEAMQRVEEARAGSPLVSAERNRQLLAEALAVAERLCQSK